MNPATAPVEVCNTNNSPLVVRVATRVPNFDTSAGPAQREFEFTVGPVRKDWMLHQPSPSSSDEIVSAEDLQQSNQQICPSPGTSGISVNVHLWLAFHQRMKIKASLLFHFTFIYCLIMVLF
ncbi:hypothetical protein ACF0H5_024297 [Mactra antiquata]